MKRSMLLVICSALALSACVSREYTKETVVQPSSHAVEVVPGSTVTVPAPQPGDTTIVVPRY